MSDEDGDHQTGCQPEGRFLDNGDGTDTCTGLMWQQATADTNGEIDDLYEQLLRKVTHRKSYVDFSKVNGIEFEDSCHSTENSSLIIARVYFGLASKALKTAR